MAERLSIVKQLHVLLCSANENTQDSEQLPESQQASSVDLWSDQEPQNALPDELTQFARNAVEEAQLYSQSPSETVQDHANPVLEPNFSEANSALLRRAMSLVTDLPSLHRLEGQLETGKTLSARDIRAQGNESALKAFHEHRDRLKVLTDPSRTRRMTKFIESCMAVRDKLKNAAEKQLLDKQIGVGQDMYSWGSPGYRRDLPKTSAFVGPLVVMTYPVNMQDMWRSATGLVSHTQKVEEVFHKGYHYEFSQQFLYIDSIPIVRHPSSLTRVTSRPQANVFSCAFDRIIMSECKVIVMRHPANRVWLLKELASAGCQGIYDLSTLYQDLYDESLNALLITDFAGRRGDSREIIFTAHPSAIGHKKMSRLEWKVHADSFALTSRIVADAYGYKCRKNRIDCSLNVLLEECKGVPQELMTAKLSGLKTLRRQEIDRNCIYALEDLPETMQREVRNRLGNVPSSGTESLLHLTLSTMATSLAGVHGLSCIEAIPASERTAEQSIALSYALAAEKYRNQFKALKVSSFSDLRATKLKNACKSRKMWNGPAWQSVLAMKRNSPRKWCKVCKNPWGYCNYSETADGRLRYGYNHSGCDAKSATDMIYSDEALQLGIVEQKHLDGLRIAYLSRGWDIILR